MAAANDMVLSTVDQGEENNSGICDGMEITPNDEDEHHKQRTDVAVDQGEENDSGIRDGMEITQNDEHEHEHQKQSIDVDVESEKAEDQETPEIVVQRPIRLNVVNDEGFQDESIHLISGRLISKTDDCKNEASTSMAKESNASLDDLTTRLSECMKCGNTTRLQDKQTQTIRNELVNVEVQTFLTGLSKNKTYKEVEYLKEIKHGGVEFKKQKQD